MAAIWRCRCDIAICRDAGKPVANDVRATNATRLYEPCRGSVEQFRASNGDCGTCRFRPSIYSRHRRRVNGELLYVLRYREISRYTSPAHRLGVNPAAWG